MREAARMILLGAISVFLTLPIATPRGPAQDSREAEWLKSGDPCWPTKQQKEQIKAMTGVEPNYLKCYPVRINMIWDFDETFHHHSDLGEDRFGVGLKVSFTGYMQIAYNQLKRTQVDDFFIAGPSPCCPPEAELLPTRLEASILGAAPKGFSGYTFRVFQVGGFDILYGRKGAGNFHLNWRRDGLDNKTQIGGPHFGIQKGAIDKSYRWGAPVWIMDHTHYRVHKIGNESATWEEVQPYFERQDVWQKTFPLEDRMDFPGTMGEFYSLRGKLTVQVDFGEEEVEDWIIAVSGTERDPLGALIEYQSPDKSIKSLPLNVAFDWLLEGKFKIKKRKGIRSYESGTITAFDQTPRILFDAGDLYRCDLAACEGRKTYEQTRKIVGMPIDGQVQGQSINIKWWNLPAEACVLCIPKKSSAGKAAVRKKFGTAQFTKLINQEFLPLKDGAQKTGGVQDWLSYRITLKKLK